MNESLLCQAVEDWDFETTKFIVESYKERNGAFHDDMDSALSVAALDGRTEMVRYLVAAGADPFGANGSALNLALVQDHAEVTAFLQEIMTAEKTALLADMNAAGDLRAWLRQPYKKTDEVPLVRAVKMKCLDAVVEKMIAAGDALTAQDLWKFKEHEDKRTLLQLANGEMQLKHLFHPKLWHGRLDEMKEAWGFLPESDQAANASLPSWCRDITCTEAVAAYHQMILKEHQPKKTVLKGPRQN